jgi:amino acid transporter
LASVSQRWGTPGAALFLQALLTIAFLVSGTFEVVAAYTVVGTGVFIILSAIALPRLRRRAAQPRRRRDRYEDLAAYFVAGVFAWFLVDLAFEDPRTAMIGLGLIAVGVLPYLVLRRRRRTASG